MPVYALGDLVPRIDPTAFVHPEAVIIGDVVIGAEASIWPCAVLRGDETGIRIGARTSIQDGSVIHNTLVLPTVVGEGCVVGHIVHLEGCTIADGALVGNGAVVLPGASVGPGAIVGSNAVVPYDKEIPAGALAIGVPVTIREGAARPEAITRSMEAYVSRATQYRRDLRRLD